MKAYYQGQESRRHEEVRADGTERIQSERDNRNHRRSATAVHGISALFAVTTRRDRAGRPYKAYRPIFYVQLRAEDGTWIQRSFPLLRDGLDKAWADAIECVGDARRLPRHERERLRRQRPDPEQFAQLRDAMNADGREIPASQLPGSAPTKAYKPAPPEPQPRPRDNHGRPIKRALTRLNVLAYLAQHGRSDPGTIGEACFGHLSARRAKDADYTVRRANARQALQRMANHGLVRLLARGDAKLTAAGQRYLEDCQ
jgi:DNA-binding transcriptional ArsR family regulator